MSVEAALEVLETADAAGLAKRRRSDDSGWHLFALSSSPLLILDRPTWLPTVKLVAPHRMRKLGEGLAAVPIIKHCAQEHPGYHVLMTTTTTSAFQVIRDQLPEGVIHQFAPVDLPASVDLFLGYWSPAAIFLMESELWPNLIIFAARRGIAVAIINARMSEKSFKHWSRPIARKLASFMLSKLSLIASMSTVEAVRFQLLHAPPHIINFTGDLKYEWMGDLSSRELSPIGGFNVPEKDNRMINDLQQQLSNRPTWMAASIHEGEEKVMLWVHEELAKIYPALMTIMVPRHPHHGRQIALALKKHGINVALRSKNEPVCAWTSFYVVDTLGELRTLYKVAPVAVIGGSFLPGLSGHNISEAAAAGCAVLTGPHVGHFSSMLMEMLQSDPLAIQQVQGKRELAESLILLLGDDRSLQARRDAARRAFSSVSNGVVHHIWDLVCARIF